MISFTSALLGIQVKGMEESDSGMGASSGEEAPPVPRHPESEQSSGEDAVHHGFL